MRRRSSKILATAALVAALGVTGCELVYDVDELAPKGNAPPPGEKAGFGEGCLSNFDCDGGLICLMQLPGGYCTVPCDDFQNTCTPMRCAPIDPASTATYCAVTCDSICRAGYICDPVENICVPGGNDDCPTPNTCQWMEVQCVRIDATGGLCNPSCCPAM